MAGESQMTAFPSLKIIYMKSSNWNNSITFKLIVSGIIMVLLTIPLILVQNVIGERENYQQETYADIASSWGARTKIDGSNSYYTI